MGGRFAGRLIDWMAGRSAQLDWLGTRSIAFAIDGLVVKVIDLAIARLDGWSLF